MLKEMKIREKEVEVSIIQFVDNNVFICKASDNDTSTIKSILKCFKIASRLKIKFHKSKIGGLGVHEHEMVRYSRILHCNCIIVPFTYLSIVVGGNSKKQDLWQRAMNKLRINYKGKKGDPYLLLVKYV